MPRVIARLLMNRRHAVGRLPRRLARLLLLTAVLFAPVCALRHASSAEPSSPPNIVFILADDMGWTDAAALGSGYYQTPHIDRLVKEGLRFSDAYSCGPNCAPTRASLMSGQYTPRHGIYTVATGARGLAKHRKLEPAPNETILSADYVTLAETLQAAGYATGHFGKWHLGSGERTGPLGQGFDLNVAGNTAGSPRSYFSPYRNPQLSDGPDGEYLTDRLTDEAIKFIDAHRDRPFFLYLPHYAVHTPIQGKPRLIEQYRERPAAAGHGNAAYAAMIDSLDQSVGRLLDRLDAWKLSDNTLVIFTSDNGGLGGYARAGAIGGKDITDNAPLRGGKGMLYEGGIRVPLIVRWPGRVEPGGTCREPVITVDFLPTLAAAAQAKLPEQIRDGVDLAALFARPAATLERPAIFWHFPGYLEVGAKTGSWRTTPCGAIRAGDWKLIEFFEDGRRELYNLASDLGEEQNLADQEPERTAALAKQLTSWRKEVGALMPTPKP